jgi:hypothetical protein
MIINRIIIVIVTDESGPVTEPVTISEVKDYGLRQTEDYDDAYITALITEARMWIEKYTGLRIIPQDIQVHFQNQSGGIELPGPIDGDIILKDKDEEVIDADDYTILGAQVETVFDDRMIAEYHVGYDAVPEWVKNAIYAYIAWAYEQRGDEKAASPDRCAAICRPYRKVTAWA